MVEFVRLLFSKPLLAAKINVTVVSTSRDGLLNEARVNVSRNGLRDGDFGHYDGDVVDDVGVAGAQPSLMDAVPLPARFPGAIVDGDDDVDAAGVDVAQLVQAESGLAADDTPLSGPEHRNHEFIVVAVRERGEPVHAVGDPFEPTSSRHLPQLDGVHADRFRVGRRDEATLLSGHSDEPVHQGHGHSVLY